MTLAQLKAQRKTHLDAARAIQQTAKAAGRDLTTEEVAAAQKELDQADAVKAQIDAAESRAAVAARLAAEDQAAAEVLPRRTTQAPAGEGLPRAEAEVLGPAFRHDAKRGFDDFGQFARMVHREIGPNGIPHSGADERIRFLAAVSGSSVGDPSSLGALLPPAFSTAIWDKMQKRPDNLLALVDRYTVTGQSLTLLAIAETSRATGSRFGGIRGYWRAEADQMQGSKPKVRELKLEPHELYVFAYVTDKLLAEGGPALTQFLERAAVDEIIFLANDAIVEGNGVGKPLGYKSAPGTVTQPKEAGQAADTIVALNIVNMWSRMWARSRANAIWLGNQDIEPQLEALSGGSAAPLYLGAGGITDAPLGRIKGRPFIPIEYADTLGDKGDLTLFDPEAYALGVKGNVETAISMHLRFDYGEQAFRFRFELDGQPWLASPLTPFKGTKTVSPIVNLAERA